MADPIGKKLTDPSIPTGTVIDDNDVSHIVDKSDTTDGPAGTSKRYSWLTIFNWILAKLNAAARLIPTGGTTGQALSKASNTDYDVEWANPTATVAANEPIQGDGSGGDPLTINFDEVPTEDSELPVWSGGVWQAIQDVINPNEMSLVDITYSALMTLVSGGTLNTKTMYRVTNAVSNTKIIRIWAVNANSLAGVAFVEGLVDGSNYFPGEFGYYDVGVDVFNAIPTISSGTYTPTVSGILNGGNVTFELDNRYLNSNGSVTVKGRILVELEASSTEEQFDFDLASVIEPSSNFSDAFDVIGCVVTVTNLSVNPGGNIYALTASKKIQVLVACGSVGQTVKFYLEANYFI